MVLTPRKFEDWYKPFTWEERVWFITAIVVALILAITTIGWTVAGVKPEVPSYAMEMGVDEAKAKALEFSAKYRGKVVPPGEDVYLTAVRFAWIPSEIMLKKGEVYRFIISSGDVLHGFSLIGPDDAVVNLMVMPGMAYIANFKFDKPGVYEIRCNEYCGVGHSFMVGRIVVVEG